MKHRDLLVGAMLRSPFTYHVGLGERPSHPRCWQWHRGAPLTARNVYMVFFDWDVHNITPVGVQVIGCAADQYKAGDHVRLEVSGYTDLSGSAAYDERLSERRANALADALARLGVPRSEMAVSGRGTDSPRIPTAPGVREPQDRSVEIVS